MCGEYIVTGEGLARVDFSKVISLNATAAYLWEQIQDKDFTPEELVDLLTARYDVDAQTALTDAEGLIAAWQKADLLDE